MGATDTTLGRTSGQEYLQDGKPLLPPTFDPRPIITFDQSGRAIRLAVIREVYDIPYGLGADVYELTSEGKYSQRHSPDTKGIGVKPISECELEAIAKQHPEEPPVVKVLGARKFSVTFLAARMGIEVKYVSDNK